MNIDAQRVLRPVEVRFVEAYLTSGDRTTAAAAARISDRTSRRFLKAPHVRDAIASAARDVLSQATKILAAGAVTAATTWRGIVEGKLPADGVRLAACSRLIEAAQKALVVDEQERRLDAIEARLAQLGASNDGRRWQ